MIKDFKLSLLVAAVAMFVNLMILVITDGIGIIQDKIDTIIVVCFVISIVALVIAGSLRLLLTVAQKSFLFGLMIPVFPINWILGCIAAVVVLGFSLMFPIVPVLLNKVLNKIDE